jgi:Mrp family chromosome partitioning ATPase
MTPIFNLEHLEKIDYATFNKEEQVVALASPYHNQGVSTLSKQLAKRSIDMGKSTLLVQFDNRSAVEKTDRDIIWLLGEPLKGKILEEDGYNRLTIGASDEDSLRWSDLETIEKFLNLLRQYFERIIIDLPPLIERATTEISPIPLAAKADSLVIISLSASLSSGEAKELVNILKLAHVTIAGIIINDRDYPTVGNELARQADKLKARFPRFAAKFAQKVRASSFLNVHY